MLLVILAAAWKEISYNFLFFLAGLQAIPLSLLEASAIDGASPRRRVTAMLLNSLVMATTLLAIVPPVMVVLLMQRWFARGLVEAEK